MRRHRACVSYLYIGVGAFLDVTTQLPTAARTQPTLMHSHPRCQFLKGRVLDFNLFLFALYRSTPIAERHSLRILFNSCVVVSVCLACSGSLLANGNVIWCFL